MVSDMSFVEQLRERAEKTGNIISFGFDPVVEKIPSKKQSVKETIVAFNRELLDAFVSEGIEPALAKPNGAFYEQYGFEGLQALKVVIEDCHARGIPVLLDVKRGDIGKTSEAYAKAVFGFWEADALTVAPYMGNDSVGPFLEYCSKGKGVYILVRTSNKGAVDVQNLDVKGVPVYRKVAEHLVRGWHVPGAGAVVGATYPAELEELSAFFVGSGKQVPLLIPGVGAQGGSAADVVGTLRKTGNPLWMHRINSSSGISYAYEKEKTTDYVGAAVRAMKELKKEIGGY